MNSSRAVINRLFSFPLVFAASLIASFPLVASADEPVFLKCEPVGDTANEFTSGILRVSGSELSYWSNANGWSENECMSDTYAVQCSKDDDFYSVEKTLATSRGTFVSSRTVHIARRTGRVTSTMLFEGKRTSHVGQCEKTDEPKLSKPKF